MRTKDENTPEANSNEDNEMPKLTVLDDYEEMMKGRQKELNSCKKVGGEWSNLLNLFNFSHFSSLRCTKKFSLIGCTAMARRRDLQ